MNAAAGLRPNKAAADPAFEAKQHIYTKARNGIMADDYAQPDKRVVLLPSVGGGPWSAR